MKPTDQPPRVRSPSLLSKRIRRSPLLLLGFIACSVAGAFGIVKLYKHLDEGYQRTMDPIRMADVDHIAELILEYLETTRDPPLQNLAQDRPYLVIIGRNRAHEAAFAEHLAGPRNARWGYSAGLESELSHGLGRPIHLPRDPQKVATYGPNVYVYYVERDFFTIAGHLYFPGETTVGYNWRGQRYHSYQYIYGRETGEASGGSEAR